MKARLQEESLRRQEESVKKQEALRKGFLLVFNNLLF
jgi:hypothetical protein